MNRHYKDDMTNILSLLACFLPIILIGIFCKYILDKHDQDIEEYDHEFDSMMD